MSNQSIFTFNDHQLRARYIDNQIWFESKDIATALNYSSSKSVTDLYNKYTNEFKPDMVTVVESTTVTNMPYKIRIFSLRGVHLIAMFARTPVAEEFRKWVLDILDKEVSESPIIIKPNREVLPKGIYHCNSKYNPYRACVWNGSEMIQIGVFPTIAEAVDAQKRFTATGETKRIQKPRINKTKPASISDSFTQNDVFAHISLFLETAQMLSFYPHGKDLSLDLVVFVQEEALRQSR